MRVRVPTQLVVAFFAAGLVSVALSGTADAGQHRHRRAHKVAAPASASFIPQASFVMDAHTGNILYAKNADAECHPASLTKVMTLYLLFGRLREGTATLNTRLPISWHAASQAPSKLGIRPGQTIRVEDAILALVTKSANDVAVAIAEYLGGSEKGFAQQMTEKAREIGMDSTQYVNASGLPDKAQLTSARDQALLAKHIQTDFPQYFPYFSTAQFAWDGTVIRNHNHLLGKYEGVTGLKTGYTAGSGFNLTTTVMRDNKSLFGVVLGGRTAQSRDMEMVSILNRALPLAAGTNYDDNLSRVDTSKEAPILISPPRRS
jgi:D-alanyl-D-alanine carboxypeptidase